MSIASERADRRDDWHELDKAMAVMSAEVNGLRNEIANMTKLLASQKTPWWQYWGPIAFFIGALGGVYLRFDDKIRALELADQISLEQRRVMALEIDEMHRKPAIQSPN